jgi:small subunit ribosomal protein S16
VRVRLTRVGSRKNPIWRVVVADQRSPRDGRVIEQIGHYNPQTQPSQITLDRGRLDHWLARGAQPTNTVRKLMKATASQGAGPDGDAAATGDGAPDEGAAASSGPAPEGAAAEDAGSGE